MFSNNSVVKKYYEILSTTGGGNTGGGGGTGGTDPIASLFIAKANIILNFYNDHNLQAFNNEIIIFNNLKTLYPSYIDNTQILVVTNFVNIIDTLYNVNLDLINQKTILENELLVEHNSFYNINMDSYNLIQNTQLDIVYLQYLLMYDLNDSNGIFIPSKLEVAKQVLINNNYVLVNLKK